MARHLTYANVVATLALFIALGGGAYAAIKLPKNSVTTLQVKNRTLLAKDFKKGQLKAGPKGTTGLTGPIGPAGSKGDQGLQGIQGTPGAAGLDGSARAYAYVTSQGQVASNSKGITTANITAKAFGEYCITGLAFTPRVAMVHPDILSNDMSDDVVAEVQVPNDGTGSCPDTDQIYVRIAYEDIDGNQGAEHIVRIGQPHGFYIEVN